MKGLLEQVILALLMTVSTGFFSLSKATVNSFNQDSNPVVFKKIQGNNDRINNLKSRQKDEEKILNSIIDYAVKYNLSDASMGTIMQKIALQFLGARYKAGLLDQSSSENLIISLTDFDCVLFVETVLAIARSIALKDYRYQTFSAHLIEQRYRNGQMNGYCSRLHYFSEWIDDNQRRGNVQNITSYLGGIPLSKKLDFMSTHRQLYPRLVKNDIDYKCILEMEANFNQLIIDYIPNYQIKLIERQLQSGDIIGIVTNIPGLDVTHTGLVYQNSDGKIGLIHASPIGKVTIADNLHQYVYNVKNAIGILVARPIDPRQVISSPVRIQTAKLTR